MADEAVNALADRRAIAMALEAAGIPSAQLPSVVEAAASFSVQLRSEVGRNGALLQLVDRIELGARSIRITVALGALLSPMHKEVSLTRDFPLTMKRRGVEMRLVLDGVGARPRTPDPVL